MLTYVWVWVRDCVVAWFRVGEEEAILGTPPRLRPEPGTSGILSSAFQSILSIYRKMKNDMASNFCLIFLRQTQITGKNIKNQHLFAVNMSYLLSRIKKEKIEMAEIYTDHHVQH